MLTKFYYEATRATYLERAKEARLRLDAALYVGDDRAADHHLGDLIEAHVRLVIARQHYYGPRRTAA